MFHLSGYADFGIDTHRQGGETTERFCTLGTLKLWYLLQRKSIVLTKEPSTLRRALGCLSSMSRTPPQAVCSAFRFGSVRFAVLAVTFLILAGCAHQGPAIFRASDLETQATSPIRLVSRGQTIGYVSKDKIKLVIEVKHRIQQAVPGIYADLFITSSKEPNAFASVTSEGYVVVVTLGMLELAGWDQDAYAAVIGHEFAHLALHHSAARSQRGVVSHTAGEILGAVLSQAGVPMGGTLSNLVVTAVERTYTRDEERDADKKGFDYLVKAGFDPAGSVRLWEKMQTEPSGFSIPFLATHPLSQERIETMKALVSARSQETELVSSRAEVPQQTIQPTKDTDSSLSSRGNESTGSVGTQRQLAVGRPVRIIREPLGLYKEASQDSERVMRLYKKDVPTVEEISGDWLKVRLDSGSSGWIMRAWVDAQ